MPLELSRDYVTSAYRIKNSSRPKSSKQDIVLEVNEEEEQLEMSTWAQGGGKKKKLIKIP